MLRSLEAVAAGDLTIEMHADRVDELGQLQQAPGHTVQSLRRVVDEVRTGVDSVDTASSQIAAGNQDLSGRPGQQASRLQRTASSMERLTGTVRQSADSAQRASQQAAAASDSAGHGGEVVTPVVATIEDITGSSRSIADIIGVVDGIAFQTNILALNAAVEAARAGELGRGFAAVAGEVRSLAQRSAPAAREIKSLIGSSLEKAEVRSRQEVEAGKAMQEIVVTVRCVTGLIGEIAGAAHEQSSAIGRVNQAVAQMDQMTRQNAALVEVSAAAAKSLAHQASRLSEVVSVFRQRGSAPQALVAAPPSRPGPAARRSQPTPAVAAADADADADGQRF